MSSPSSLLFHLVLTLRTEPFSLWSVCKSNTSVMEPLDRALGAKKGKTGMNESVNNAVLRETKIQSVLALKSSGGGVGVGRRTPFNGPHREAPPKKGYHFQVSRK